MTPYHIYKQGEGWIASAETLQGAKLAIKALIEDEYGENRPQLVEEIYWIIIDHDRN